MAVAFASEVHTSNALRFLSSHRFSAQVEAFLANSIAEHGPSILSNPGMAELFAPGGKLLKVGDMAYRRKLAEVGIHSLASKDTAHNRCKTQESVTCKTMSLIASEGKQSNVGDMAYCKELADWRHRSLASKDPPHNCWILG